MKRSALPLVRGVYGFVRRCRIPASLQAWRKRGCGRAEPAQDAGDGRDRNAELAGDCGRAHPLPAQPFDLGHPLGRKPVRRVGGRRASVMEGRLAARPPTSHPLANRLHADAEIGCDLLARLFGVNDPVDHEESTVRRRTSILVDVHSELPAWLLMATTTSFPSPLRMNNLHSNYS